MRTRTRLTLLAIGLASSACGGGGAPSAQSFAGTWNASKYELVNPSSPTTRVDLISQGAVATLVLGADNTYQAILRLPGQADEVSTGTWSASVDVLTLRQEAPFSSTLEFNYALTPTTLTLRGGGSEWDFDGDGTPEQATLNVDAVRG